MPSSAESHSDINYVEKRKFPRVAYDQKGEFELRTKGASRASGTMDIVCLSPEGARISLHDEPDPLPEKGHLLTLRFKLDAEDLELPARVVWRRTKKERVVLGLELLLEYTSANMRHTYARWIVNKLRT